MMTSNAEDVKQPLSAPDPRRLIHMTAALELSWAGRPFTASDVMRRTGGTRATALTVCSELIDRRWFVELENAVPATRGGRPARRFRLDPDAALAIGVDAGVHRMHAIAVDALGHEIARATRPIEADAPLDERVAAVRALIAELSAPDRSTRRAACVGVPAPVDEAGRSPGPAGHFWQIMNPGYADGLASCADLVTIDNDANLAASAERMIGGAQDHDWFAAVMTGTGLGAGLFVDGRLLRGYKGMAGELGFLEYVMDVWSSEGLGTFAERRAGEAAYSGTPARLPDGRVARTADEVFAAAKAGDAKADKIVDDLATRLARIAAVLADAVGIQRVIVTGDVVRDVDVVLARAVRALPKHAIGDPPELVASTLGGDAVALGAAHRALASLREGALELSVSRPPA